MRSTSDTVLTSGISFQPSRSIVLLPSRKPWLRRATFVTACVIVLSVIAIVLGIKDEQTTKKLLRIRDLTLNRCIDICRSEEVTALHMKSLSEPVDSINQVKM